MVRGENNQAHVCMLLLHIVQWSKCGKITEHCLLLIVQKPRIILKKKPCLKEFFFCIMSPATEFHHKKIRPTTRKMSFLPSNCHGSSTDETNTVLSFVGHFDFS